MGNNYIETINYGGYYRPKPRKSHNGKLLVLIIVICIAIIVLWLGGFLKPIDREASYQNLIDKVCDVSIDYVLDPKYRDYIEGINVPGQVVYIKVNDLVKANLIEAELKNYKTDEMIPLSTDIKLTVVTTEDIMCEGFAWPEDDRVVPIVHLNGDATMYLNIGEKFVDPGAYATDNRDGDITNKIAVSGTIDTSKAGTYYIYYVVKDRAGNLSTKVTRTVIVK